MNRRSFLSAIISLAAGLVGVRVAKAATSTMISKCTIPKSKCTIPKSLAVQIECLPIWTRYPFRTPVT